MSLQALLEVISKLRSPEGCPWDRAQTHESLAPYAVEEATELQNALYGGRTQEIVDELGDVLLQVVLHSQLLKEKGLGDLDAVAEHLRLKLIRRHPHVFEDPKDRTKEEVQALWEQIKRKERQGKPQGVSKGLSGLRRAHRLGEAAKKLDFDWDQPEQVWAKVEEELTELKTATPESQAEELGDLLFSLAQWARHQGLDAEGELQKANLKFERRFQSAQQKAQAQNLKWLEISAEDKEALWRQVKDDERS